MENLAYTSGRSAKKNNNPRKRHYNVGVLKENMIKVSAIKRQQIS